MRGDTLGKPVEYKYHGKFNDSMPQAVEKKKKRMESNLLSPHMKCRI